MTLFWLKQTVIALMFCKCARNCALLHLSQNILSLNSCIFSNVSNMNNKIIIEVKDVFHTIPTHSYYLCILDNLKFPKYTFLIC